MSDEEEWTHARRVEAIRHQIGDLMDEATIPTAARYNLREAFFALRDAHQIMISGYSPMRGTKKGER